MCRHSKPHNVIHDEAENLLVDEDQVGARWRRHWAKLLKMSNLLKHTNMRTTTRDADT